MPSGRRLVQHVVDEERFVISGTFIWCLSDVDIEDEGFVCAIVATVRSPTNHRRRVQRFQSRWQIPVLGRGPTAELVPSRIHRRSVRRHPVQWRARNRCGEVVPMRHGRFAYMSSSGHHELDVLPVPPAGQRRRSSGQVVQRPGQPPIPLSVSVDHAAALRASSEACRVGKEVICAGPV